MSKVEFVIVDNISLLRECLEAISDTRVISHDTETSGLDPFAPGSWLTSIGFGTGKQMWCIPFEHQESRIKGKYQIQKSWLKKIKRAIKGKVIVAHGGKFDAKWVRHLYGLDFRPTFDTLLAHYNLDENSPHDLEYLATKYFGAPKYDIPLKEKHGFGDLKDHCEYLGFDLHWTRKLYFKFRKELKKDRLTYTLFKKLTMPVSHMFTDVELHGVYIDPSKLDDAQAYWEERANKALKYLNKKFPSDNSWKDKKTKNILHGINWNSPDQVAEVLFGRLKLKPLDTTGTGKPSTSESVLKRLNHKAADTILEYREATKNLGTFIESWRGKCYDGNRIHCSFLVHGTVTGRPSCREPNLQQTPRDPRIRSLVTAPEGWTLLEVDYSQVELRVLAELSQDPTLVYSYLINEDVHSKTVTTIFGILNPTSDERKKGKAINFGFMYGMMPPKFIIYARDNYGVDFTLPEARKVRKGYFQLYGGLPDWHRHQKAMANRHGYVRNMIGRKRRLPDAMKKSEGDYDYKKAEAERQAINSPVQSLASDFNLMSAVELHKKVPKEYFRIVGTIHDAILMEVRNDKVIEVAREIKKTMENPSLLKELNVDFKTPLISELKQGPWSLGKEIKL